MPHPSVSVLQRNRTNTPIEISFKKLTHSIVRADKARIPKADGKMEIQAVGDVAGRQTGYLGRISTLHS